MTKSNPITEPTEGNELKVDGIGVSSTPITVFSGSLENTKKIDQDVPDTDTQKKSNPGNPPISSPKQAASIYDVYDIVPSNFGTIVREYSYNIGEVSSSKFDMSIRNKAIQNSIEIAVILPEFLTTDDSSALKEQNGVIRFTLTPRTEGIFSLIVNNIVAANLAFQKNYTITEDMKILSRLINVTGPVLINPW